MLLNSLSHMCLSPRFPQSIPQFPTVEGRRSVRFGSRGAAHVEPAGKTRDPILKYRPLIDQVTPPYTPRSQASHEAIKSARLLQRGSTRGDETTRAGYA